MKPSAKQVYEQFVAIIKEATTDKNIYAVPRAAEALHLSGGEETHGIGQRWNYTYQDSDGLEVLIHARWWDQSKAFSIQPDKHVMSVALKGSEIAESYSDSYEE